MPMPMPDKGEDEAKFVGRCMSDEMMNKDYGDNKQRLAVCHSLFEKKEEKSMPSMGMIEYRMMPQAEIKVDGEKEQRIVGYAAVFESLSQEMGYGPARFREKIRRGAFLKSIEQDDIRALKNHNPDVVLGRNKAGTLRLSEDPHGLYFEIIPPDTQEANDLIKSIKRGDVTQNSFGFVISKNGDEWNRADKVRTLTNVRLLDISPVTYAAYEETEVFVRSKGNFYILPQDRFFLSEVNPTATILPKHEGDDPSQPNVIIPAPQFMTPDFWAKFENIVNRRK